MCSSIFGGAKVEKVKAPEVTRVDPTPVNVTSSDVADNGDAESVRRKQKAKRGYAATRLAETGSAGKDTLG